MCCAVKKDSPHLEFWEEMLLFVKTWTFVDKNGKIISTHCKKEWQVTLRSAIDMRRHLLKQHDFLLMKRFNQDALENTFSFIRAERGNDSNPDCSQFNSCIKAIILNNVFSASNSSNCEEDLDKVFLSIQDTENISMQALFEKKTFEGVYETNFDQIDSMLVTNDVLLKMNENVLFYIFGYIGKKILKQLDGCKKCEEKFFENSENLLHDNSLLTIFKRL